MGSWESASTLCARMLRVVLACSLSLALMGQQVEDDWVDPYDMLNYDATTKTMRKPTEPANYNNVATKRREYTQDSCQAQLASCSRHVEDLQRQIEEPKKTKHISQPPSCNPVFKRFFSRLLNEIRRVGLPSDSSDSFYDAKVKLSQQSITEIQTLLEGEDGCRTGALDSAISQILVDLRPHDFEAWKWHFEDTFGVELDTLLKMGLCVLVFMAIICTQLWSTVSWFVQFHRLFAVCFFVSIIWNWFYLYKIAFAEHQKNIVKMDSFNEKCTGVQRIGWTDSLKEWYRSTWTLQDDPCKTFYEVLVVNPLLLVPPTKAISVTITTFITEPLKHLGQGISEFLRALLKDLPVTLQIPVLLIIVLAIVVFMYGSVQAAFQHGITAPLRGPRRDPPAPELVQPQPRLLGPLGGGDGPPQVPRYQVYDGRLHRNQVHQRRGNRLQMEPSQLPVETLQTVYLSNSEDEMDGGWCEAEQNVSTEPNSENQQEAQEEPTGASGRSLSAQDKTKPTESDSAQSKETNEDSAPRTKPAEKQPSRSDVEELGALPEGNSSIPHNENVKPPVQETGQQPAI
ncbi:Chloride channel CLIC-like protein 1 Precursor [Channa argus]|uniref:Chloride channel CLIC-like protein 1 n=1 Tax=Channa argus TaxID=215402 RepID=A0A6G1PKZ8_CHAAH|nr:Chloride channel CLIC-like protein 1 Precursor [Channa argus]